MKFNYLFIVIFCSFCFSLNAQTVIHSADFESGNDSWTDGGSDAARGNTGAYTGSWALNVRSNSSSSNWISPAFSLAVYDKVDFKFFFSTGGYDNGEIFYIEYRDNNSASWVQIASYVCQNPINKNADFRATNTPTEFYAKTVTIFKAAGFVFPAAATAQFRVRSNSNSTSDYIYFDAVTITGTTFNTITKGPGGITNNLDLWLRADQVNGTNVNVDGSNLTKWVDKGKGNNAEVVVAGQEPVYRNSAARNMNFNPVVDFENDHTTASGDMRYINTRDELKGTGGFNSHDMFMVVMPDPTITTSMWPLDTFTSTDPLGNSYTEDVTGFGYGGYTARVTGEYFTYCIGTTSTSAPFPGYARADRSGSNNYNQIGFVNVRHNAAADDMELYLNANQVGTYTNDKPDFAGISNARYWLGRSQYWNGSFDGRIAEVITYSARKNDVTERTKIESYLAVKYGITLGINGTSKNYVDSANTTIWNVSANSGYNYDIAGIGRDDASNLNQKQSKSVNTASDGLGEIRGLVTMGLSNIYTTNYDNVTTNPTTFTDKEFLVWGNNNGDLNLAPNVVNVDMSAGIAGLSTPVTFTGMARIWKVVETGGDVPSVKVTIPQNAVRNISPPGSYLMFISSTGIFDPTADYRVMTQSGGNLYADYDFDGTKYITFGYAPETIVERSIYFDGVVDYVDMEDALNLNPTAFTVSAWIKRGAGSNNTSILSKRDATYTEGYDFKITNTGLLQMVWNGGTQSVTSSTVIPQNKWHHVAVIYNGGTATLYIDGIADGTASSLTNPVATTQSFYIAAAGKNTPTAHFEGNIDEVRIWNVALSVNQLRYVMNQEIENNGSFVNGIKIPKAIPKNEVVTIPWTNLAGYYPMSVYTYTNTNDASGNGNQGALRNLDTVDWQTAPLPYKSTANGNWDTPSTWLNNTVQELPNSLSIVDGTTPIDWNIVQTNHDINSGDRDITVLGLISETGKLTIADPVVTSPIENNNGQSLRITHYFELDGNIDLVGESQLLQDSNCILDADSGGFIERDQQGTASSFNYNYWSSPVGPITSGIGTRGTGISSSNTNYTINGIVQDGTVSNSPLAINFQPVYNAADGVATSPITISSYWLWKFHGTDDDYDSWLKIDETSSLLPGEGYTMKGTSGVAAITTPQNYVNKGKPFNGDISLPLTSGFDRLIGNPYASAMDADEFIKDNISVGNGGRAATNVINGTLYFWDHFSGATHVLGQYVGGYATYTLIGGVSAISNDIRINNNGAVSTKTPERYIPVNQGFFVVADVGGSVIFKNSQRAFKREGATVDNSGSLFLKANNNHKSEKSLQENIDIRAKIILQFDSPSGYHRKLLVGVDENASNNFDIGYDGPLIESNFEDMFWIIDDDKYVIQGVNNFEFDQEFPLGLKIDQSGQATIKIDETNNVNADLEFYIKDSLTGDVVNITYNPFQIFLNEGEYKDRFSLLFKSKSLNVEEEENLKEKVFIFMNNNTSEIEIKKDLETEIKSIYIYNYLGQTMKVWNQNFDENIFNLPIHFNSGVYLIQVNTKEGITSKKIIIE